MPNSNAQVSSLLNSNLMRDAQKLCPELTKEAILQMALQTFVHKMRKKRLSRHANKDAWDACQ